MGALSPLHIILLVLVVLLIFGSKRLVGLGRDLGQGLRSLRDSIADEGRHEAPRAPDAPGDPARPAQVAAPTPEVAAAEAVEERRPG